MYLGPGGIWSDSRLLLSYSDLGNQLNEPIEVLVEFPYPQSNDVKQKGRYLFSFAAVAAGVEVDLLTGKVMVLGLDQAIKLQVRSLVQWVILAKLRVVE